MTLEELTDVLNVSFDDALLGTLQALIIIVPPMLITILIVWLFARQMKVKESGVNIILHGSTYGFIGLIIAYLYSDRGDSTLAGLLPHFITLVAISFQLASRMKDGLKVPTESQASVTAAAAAAFCFMFGSIYFESFDIPSKENEENTAVTSG